MPSLANQPGNRIQHGALIVAKHGVDLRMMHMLTKRRHHLPVRTNRRSISVSVR
jgi:hypothetical protein